MSWYLLVVLALLPFLGSAAQRGEVCLTEWGESATCTSIYSCRAAIDVLVNATGSTFYVAGRICGYDIEPLVCCMTNDIRPNTQLPPVPVSHNISFLIAFSRDSLNLNPPTTTDSTTSKSSEFPSLLSTFISNTLQPPEPFSTIPPNLDNRFNNKNKTHNEEVVYGYPDEHKNVEEQKPINPWHNEDVVTEYKPLYHSTTPREIIRYPDEHKHVEEHKPIIPWNNEDVVTEYKPLYTSTTPHEIISSTEYYPNMDKAPPLSAALPGRDVCGFENDGDRLLNSSLSAIDEFPWTALLKYSFHNGNNAGFRCVGTLVNAKHVITTASCAINNDVFYLESVRFGAWSIDNLRDCVNTQHGEACTDKVVDVAVKYKVPHPDYSPTHGKNNIALVCLKKAVEYSDFIRPICLPGALDVPHVGSIFTTAGWGVTKYGSQLEIKSKIHLPVLPKESCSDIFGYSYGTDHRVCIGGLADKETCSTDTGGPVMIKNEKYNQWYLEGVICESYSCQRKASPGVYTGMAGYVDWLLDAIEQGKKF